MFASLVFNSLLRSCVVLVSSYAYVLLFLGLGLGLGLRRARIVLRLRSAVSLFVALRPTTCVLSPA